MRQTWLVLCKFLSALAATTLLYGTAWAVFPPPPYPVIFIHSFSTDACAWRDLAERLVFNESWRYGGEYLPDQTGSVSLGDKPCLATVRSEVATNADFYLLSFSSSENLTLRQQGFELKQVIDRVLRRTGKDRVILVGWSMGGLAARAYLEFLADPNAPKVQHLITFGTPHLGSDLARRCREEWEVVCRMIGRDPTSAAIRALAPESEELNELNAAINQLPAATLYTSIVVRGRIDLFGDGAVSDRSQNLANVPLVGASRWDIRHRAPEVRMLDACNPLAGELTPHQCEPSDGAVQNAILNAVTASNVSIELVADRREVTSGQMFTVSLRLHPQRPDAMKSLYVALQQPDGSLVFQYGLGQDFTWGPGLAPVRDFTPLLDREVITTSLLAGQYVFAALFVEPGRDPTDRNNWRSNIALLAITVGVRSRVETVPVLYAASTNNWPTPAKLWQVEPRWNGQDTLVGTFRTRTGRRVEVIDLAITPAGELFGLSAADPYQSRGWNTDRENTLYHIDPDTAIATPIGGLGIADGYMVALAAGRDGELYAAGSVGIMFGGAAIFRVDPRTGRAISAGRLGEALGAGTVSGLAAHPETNQLYLTMEPGPFGFSGDQLLIVNLASRRYREVGFIGWTGVKLAFVGRDLYGLTTTGTLLYIDSATAQATALRNVNFEVAGAALQAGDTR